MGRAGPGYISPKVQRDSIQRWADYRHVQIVAWHVDEDQSGGTQDRPGLRTLMARIEAGETEGLACWRLNRFARNVAEALHDVERIHHSGAHLACVEEDIDPTGPFGRFILTILLAVAALERDNLMAGLEEAKRRALDRGAYIARTPFGYQRNPDSTLSPHPVHGPHVSQAFRLAAAGDIQDAMRYLRQNVPERTWTTNTTRRVISRRAYLGEIHIGSQPVREAAHDPLVSRAVWEAAQSSPTARKGSEAFPLSGLARCGTCGSAMVGSRGGIGQRTYRCSARENCDRSAVITADRLEEYVRSRAVSMLAGLTVIVSDPDADTLTLLERELADSEAELNAFAGDLHARRALGNRYHEHLDSRVAAVEKARELYREQARAAQANLSLPTSALLNMDDPQAFSAGLRSIVDSILVMPGRGLAVEDRVRLTPLDANSPTGIPGTEQS